MQKDQSKIERAFLELGYTLEDAKEYKWDIRKAWDTYFAEQGRRLDIAMDYFLKGEDYVAQYIGPFKTEQDARAHVAKLDKLFGNDEPTQVVLDGQPFERPSFGTVYTIMRAGYVPLDDRRFGDCLSTPQDDIETCEGIQAERADHEMGDPNP